MIMDSHSSNDKLSMSAENSGEEDDCLVISEKENTAYESQREQKKPFEKRRKPRNKT